MKHELWLTKVLIKLCTCKTLDFCYASNAATIPLVLVELIGGGEQLPSDDPLVHLLPYYFKKMCRLRMFQKSYRSVYAAKNKEKVVYKYT